MKSNMTTENLIAAFNKYADEYLSFIDVANKLSRRPDMHAFILLDKLIPGDGMSDLITAAEHDQFFIGIKPEALAMVATEEIILELVRCGIVYDEDTESLSFFA